MALQVIGSGGAEAAMAFNAVDSDGDGSSSSFIKQQIIKEEMRREDL